MIEIFCSDIAGGLDTISGLLSLSLAFSAWFCGMFVDFVLSLVNLLYIVYETQVKYDFLNDYFIIIIIT